MYFLSAVFALPGNFLLIGFAVCSAIAITTHSSSHAFGWAPLTLAVAVFLCAIAVSTVGSVDVDRSLRLSAPLMPAVLLFVVVTAHSAGARDIRLLYLVLSAIGLGLAATLLWSAWSPANGMSLFEVVPRLGIPILVVPNDVTILALIAPLSLMLLFREPRGPVSVVSGLSILLSVATVCAYRSRTAVLAMSIALLSAAAFSRCYRRRTFWAVGLPAALLLVALICIDVPQFPGSSLLNKFHEAGLNGRMGQWTNAWTMYLSAPLLGQGPHTFGLFHTPPWPHNLYLEVLAEQGLLGLITFGGMLVFGIVGGWKLRRAPTEDTRYLGVGALAALIALCSAGMFELTLVREWVVTILFTLLSVINQLMSSQIKQRAVNE